MKDFIRLLRKKADKLLDPGHLSWLDKNPLEQGKSYKPACSLEVRAVGNDIAALEGQVLEQAWVTSPGAVQPQVKSVWKFVPKICMPVPTSLAQRERGSL